MKSLKILIFTLLLSMLLIPALTQVPVDTTGYGSKIDSTLRDHGIDPRTFDPSILIQIGINVSCGYVGTVGVNNVLGPIGFYASASQSLHETGVTYGSTLDVLYFIKNNPHYVHLIAGYGRVRDIRPQFSEIPAHNMYEIGASVAYPITKGKRWRVSTLWLYNNQLKLTATGGLLFKIY